mmetsp:Transcript_16827/g.40010  ORF Transcript_16827/g.40010 Transcript_16827/m.40010 type:complete len:294 (+) Transcript_16827:536-1417(+)
MEVETGERGENPRAVRVLPRLERLGERLGTLRPDVVVDEVEVGEVGAEHPRAGGVLAGGEHRGQRLRPGVSDVVAPEVEGCEVPVPRPPSARLELRAQRARNGRGALRADLAPQQLQGRDCPVEGEAPIRVRPRLHQLGEGLRAAAPEIAEPPCDVDCGAGKGDREIGAAVEGAEPAPVLRLAEGHLQRRAAAEQLRNALVRVLHLPLVPEALRLAGPLPIHVLPEAVDLRALRTLRLGPKAVPLLPALDLGLEALIPLSNEVCQPHVCEWAGVVPSLKPLHNGVQVVRHTGL